jgi:hypothetical protein
VGQTARRLVTGLLINVYFKVGSVRGLIWKKGTLPLIFQEDQKSTPEYQRTIACLRAEI